MDQLVRNAASFEIPKQKAPRKRRFPPRRLCVWSLLTLILSFCLVQENRLVHAEDAQGDDKVANDDAAGDDGNAAAANDDGSSSSSSNSYQNEQKQYQNADDDTFHWNSNIGFDGVSVMPLSCIN